LVLAEWLNRLGQILFYPPNVGGWNGGRGWLSTRTVIARANFATSLANGQLTNPPRRLETPRGLFKDTQSAERMADLGRLLCGSQISSATEQAAETPGSPRELGDLFQHFVQTVLTRPEAQMN